MRPDNTLMEATPGLSAVIEDEHGCVEFQEALWDLPYFGRPVVQVNDLVLKDGTALTGVVDRMLEACRAKAVRFHDPTMTLHWVP